MKYITLDNMLEMYRRGHRIRRGGDFSNVPKDTITKDTITNPDNNQNNSSQRYYINQSFYKSQYSNI